MKNLYLVLAIVFFAAGMVLLLLTLVMGERMQAIPLGGNLTFSPTWAWAALLVLACWNLLRWTLSPRRRAPRDPLQETIEARRRMHEAEERHGPPDPNFNFTDPAPFPPEPRRTDGPPSAN